MYTSGLISYTESENMAFASSKKILGNVWQILQLPIDVVKLEKVNPSSQGLSQDKIIDGAGNFETYFWN